MGPIKPATPIENGAHALELAKVEFLPDEDVLDAAPDEGEGSHVGFAGPSDMPPGQSGAVGSPRDAGADVRISQIERRESIRHFAVLVAVLAAIVASVFARPRDSVRDSVDVSQVQRPRGAAGGAESATAASPPERAAGEGSSAPAASGHVNSEALEAKLASQTALQEGKVAEAIEAGERAVALDPTDAEAWLILATSYDRRGTHEDARRCFASCVRLATHGPRAECVALGP
jgi:cytochrome c-type biogenesis protein CcmH/NrfG